MRRQKPLKLTPLEEKWEAILAKEGLADLERRPSGHLKEYDSFRFASYSKDEFRERELYYQLATDLLNKEVFQSKMDRKIWELHSEGFESLEIFKKLKAKTSLRTIKRRLSLYRKYLVHHT